MPTLLPLSPPLPPALADVDWEVYTVVDVVDFLPATTTKFEDDHLRTEIYRYERRAPPPSVYANDERGCRVCRATKPLVDRLDP